MNHETGKMQKKELPTDIKKLTGKIPSVFSKAYCKTYNDYIKDTA